MHIYDYNDWFTLLVGFAIYIMGLRIYWIDTSNRMYQSFMISTFFLFIQNLFFFAVDQTNNVANALQLRPWLEMSGDLASVFFCLAAWFYAQQFTPHSFSRREKKYFYALLIVSSVFIIIELFVPFGMVGEIFLNDNKKWSVKVVSSQWLDWLNIIWVFLLYSTTIYLTYLPFKYALNQLSRRRCAIVFFLLFSILAGVFIRNYILTIFFQIPLLLNGSINIAFGVLLSRLLLLKLQLNDLNSNYVVPNLLKNMTNWFILTDSNFNISRANGAFLDKMGKDINYWQNYSIDTLLNTPKWQEHKEEITALRKGEIAEYEFRVSNNKQEYDLNFAITPVFNQSKISFLKNDKIRAYAFIGTDVSEFKASENQAKSYAKELENSVQALESFAFITSHDLKEPIRNIGSFTGLLKHRIGDESTPEIAECFEFIESSVKGMNQLVNSIMAISRIGKEGLHFELIDMNKLLSEKKKRLVAVLQKSNTLLKIEKLPVIKGDIQLIQQLLQNLIENSIKYNTTKQPTISIYSELINHQVVIKIEDNGIGIEEEYREQVFEMFKRLHSKKTYEGSGIGLAICKRIMELHQGQISIEHPKKGIGTTFALHFKTAIE